MWRPLYANGESGRIRGILHAVATDLAGSPAGFGWSVSAGAAGLALFYSYLDQAMPDARCREQAVRHARRALERASADVWNPSLFSGLPGVIYAIEQMAERHAYDVGDLPSDVVDERMFDTVRHAHWRGNLDVCEGLVGFGVYALRRNSQLSRNILEQIVGRLEECAIRTPDGVTWSMPFMPSSAPMDAAVDEVNLGVAHGPPSVVAFLGQVCKAGICVQVARPLLDASVSWLLAQRNPPGMTSAFSYSAKLRSPDAGGEARLAWCYGDLGISAALFIAGTSVDQPAWTSIALELAAKSAGRSVESSGVCDAGLCHGAAGNAHLFNRFYQATGDPRFMEAARRWFDVAIGFHRPNISVGGFPFWNEQLGRGQYGVPGLLLGAAGVGLAFLAAITPTEPTWDRLLLMSSHQAGRP